MFPNKGSRQVKVSNEKFGKLEKPTCQKQTGGYVSESSNISEKQAENVIHSRINQQLFDSFQSPLNISPTVSNVDPQIEEVGLIAGRLSRFVNIWKELTNDKSVINYLKVGYKISFKKTPNQNVIPDEPIWNQKEFLNIKNEIKKLRSKGAIEKCKERKDQFISPYFLVPKPNGSCRFILNLKKLNKFINPPHF